MRMPLPSFSWANGAEVWNCMLDKDASYSKLRTDNMLERHPALVDTYRTILLDWLSEVSQECKFHRETYHLAVDFIDRYLSAANNVNKLQLQLIGTTCLFLAAKFEEIRPPSVHEFADLTDGACKADDIIENEVVILSAIKWEITPMTPNNWLNIYMQIMLNLDDKCEEEELNERGCQIESNKSNKEAKNNLKTTNTTTITRSKSKNNDCDESPIQIVDENSSSAKSDTIPLSSRETNATIAKASATTKNDSFILPANNGIFKSNHKRIASVIDLALLHIESLRFPNSILTASALYYFTDELTVRQCTGFQYQELAVCVRWLKPFVETIKEIREPVFLATCKNELNSTQMHSHIASGKLLDKVLVKIANSVAASEIMIAPGQSLKRKMCAAFDEEVTDSENDSILSPTKPTTLLTPPRSVRKSRRVH